MTDYITREELAQACERAALTRRVGRAPNDSELRALAGELRRGAPTEAAHARLDQDRTARPKTRIVGHARAGDCVDGSGERLEYIDEDGQRTVLEQAEEALPNAVIRWRFETPASREASLEWLERVINGGTRENTDMVHCLRWLATAPAGAVGRLALRGDVLRVVREWQSLAAERIINAISDHADHEKQERCDDARRRMLGKLAPAQVLDADALVPLLRVVRRLRRLLSADYPESRTRLDMAWDELPNEWKELTE